MKQILLVIGCVLLSSSLYSQKSCDEYIHRIDSLIQLNVYLDFDSQRLKIKPVESCESALFDYTKDKGYYGDSTAYQSRINNILRYLSGEAINQSIREKSINALLDRSYAFDVSSSFRWDKEDFNAQAKLHLKRLLKREYTPVEIERYVKESNKYRYKYHPLDTIVKYIAIENKQDFQHVKDSILKVDYEVPKKRLFEEERYERLLPVFIGWLDMKECIPLLDSMYRADKNIAIAMALARLGVEEYRQYFENAKVVYRDVAFYIGTQEMIYKYGKELYSKETKVYISGSPPPLRPGEIPKDIDYYNPKIPIAYNVVIYLQKNIVNFPQLIDRKTNIMFQETLQQIPPDTLEKAQKWMEENKGNYKLEEFYPEFTPEMFEGYDENKTERKFF